MSRLLIEEYTGFFQRGEGGFTIPVLNGAPPVRQWLEEVEGGEASAAFADGTKLIEVTADADLHIAIGPDVAAATSADGVLWAHERRHFVVGPGWTLAAIAYDPAPVVEE